MAAWSLSDAVPRLSSRDNTLKYISLNGKRHTDAQLAELVDLLLAHPDVATSVQLSENELTDATGVRLAGYIAASSAVEALLLNDNHFSDEVYLAVAAALRVNTSVRSLYLMYNQSVDKSRVDAAFVEALRLNPDRPADSMWSLYTLVNDFPRLKAAAEQLGHPSLQMLLCGETNPKDAEKGMRD